MIILNTNAELKKTFARLIKTMKEPVEWSGRFVVIGDYLILLGRVRSLFFNFESRKVVTNLIEIPEQSEEPVEIGDQSKVQNVLNMVLYSFGKWGMIRGIKVDQDYAQLNRLFTGVLQEFSVEPGYSRENFRFYRDGIRLTYEDVVSLAIVPDEETEQTEVRKEESASGLWHKLVWKKHKASFPKTETTFEDRQKNRLGNNFYMVGYQCPKCKNHLHMTVFPEGKEFRVETSEGGVFLARAYACEACRSFYTPRPQKLLSEGDVYYMEFAVDEQAYRDYKELLRAAGDKLSNYKFNEFEEVRKRKAKLQVEEKEEPLGELCSRMEDMSDKMLAELADKIEEGFYPAQSVRKFEQAVQNEANRRRMKKSVAKADEAARMTKQSADSIRMPAEERKPDAIFRMQARAAAPETGIGAAENSAKGEEAFHGQKRQAIPSSRREAAKKRYEAKCSVLDRLSSAQIAELRQELKRDKSLYEEEKEPFYQALEKKEKKKKQERMLSLSSGCMGQSYAKVRRAAEEIEKIDLPMDEKTSVLKALYAEKKRQGEAEAASLIQKMPKRLDLKQYHEYLEKLKGYPEVNLAPYEEILDERKKQAQKQEISNMISHARMTDRQGLTDLVDRLKGKNFEEELLLPYLEKLEDKIRAMDEDAIAKICGNPRMTAEEVTEAYEKIESGDFLPELKTNALNMLKKRLQKLKTEECDLLVEKFKRDLDGRIKENDRHHFYPAKRMMTGEAKPEECKVIQYALDTYGTTRGMFEYPILVMDTSRDRSGKEGVILTPEHLFYRTMMNAFVLSIGDIKRIYAQTGLLHTGLFAERRDGTKIKLPYAVDRKEIVAWGNCLEEFIHYLQEKPDSRNVTYLAKEKHETICCFRCGYTYKGDGVCPKCGYKSNQ